MYGFACRCGAGSGSYSFGLEFPETAVGWLEQGRSDDWKDLFQLRSSYEELSSGYPDRARRLQELSAALEHASAREKSSSTLSEQIQCQVRAPGGYGRMA